MDVEKNGVMSHSSEGNCEYKNNSILQATALKKSFSIATEALDQIQFKGDLFTIVDYGCCDGGNSMEIMEKSIKYVKGVYGSDLSVQVVYNDLIENDFKSLFRELWGTWNSLSDRKLFLKMFACETLIHTCAAISDKESYYWKYSDIYLSAVPVDFYRKCVPNKTVNFGMATTVFHWLSHRPCRLANSVCYAADCSDTERDAWATAWRKDFTKLMVNRSEELAEGGCLFIIIPDGYNSPPVYPTFSTLNKIYRQLVQEGILTQAEFENSSLNIYMPRFEELERIFFKDGLVTQRGLQLLRIDSVKPEPNYNVWEKDIEDKPSAICAQTNRYVNNLMCWTVVPLKEGLSVTRSEIEKDSIMDTVFERFHEEVKSSSWLFLHDLCSSVVVIRKAQVKSD